MVEDLALFWDFFFAPLYAIDDWGPISSVIFGVIVICGVFHILGLIFFGFGRKKS